MLVTPCRFDGLAPGIVDPHTHYDAQLFWDPAASPSNLHGVTSMVAGNCGFTLAPIDPVDVDYLRQMMAKVEGMPLPALETGVPWSWRSFGDYLGEHEGTSLEYVTDGCLRGFTDAEVEQMAEMTLAGRRALNWNVLTIDAKEPQRYRDQVAACENARARGGTVVALTMPILVEMNMSFLNYCALFMMPGWSDVMNLPVPERIAKLRDPEVRRWMDERARSPEAGVFSRLASWGRYQIGDTFSAANDGLKNKIVSDLAKEQGKTPFDTLVDIVIEDDLRTVLWPLPSDGDEKSWQLRAEAWDHPLVMIGGSDAGAHLDRMCGAPYTTSFLADTLRGRQLVSLERCVQLITQAPAQLFGLRDRGEIRPGAYADVVMF